MPADLLNAGTAMATVLFARPNLPACFLLKSSMTSIAPCLPALVVGLVTNPLVTKRFNVFSAVSRPVTLNALVTIPLAKPLAVIFAPVLAVR